MQKEPEVIVSDQQKAIIGAITDLKKDGEFAGFHLFDTYHVIKNLKKKTAN